jgi:hypothetical protein
MITFTTEQAHREHVLRAAGWVLTGGLWRSPDGLVANFAAAWDTVEAGGGR